MGKLTIGTRRSNTPPKLRAAAIATMAIGVALLVAYLIFRRVVTYSFPDGDVPKHALVTTPGARGAQSSLRYGPSSLAYVGPIAVLRLVGKPHTLGAAAGRLLGPAIGEISATLDPAIASTVTTSGFLGSSTHDARLRWKTRMLDDGIPGHQLLELSGLVRGAGKSSGHQPSFESLLRQQAVLDIGAAPIASDGHRFRAMTRSLSFAATLRGTSGDRLLIGRSLAVPGALDGGNTIAHSITVSFVRDPDGEMIPFASVGWPGLVGVVSGINAEGIAVMLHPTRAANVRITREAQPSALLAREILENARTLDDAVAILEHASPLGAAVFFVVDGNERTWAIVDRTPETVVVQRGRKPAVATDLLLSDELADDPENDRSRRIRPSTMRAERAAQLLRKPITDAAGVAAIMRDSRSPSNTALPLGHRGRVEDIAAVHAAIFDVSGMVLWVNEGPGPDGRFRAFDLRYELRDEGARPAPPPDLPASVAFDPGDARAVLQARRELRAARAAWNHGHHDRAREAVQRALARAPSLPEALRLAGRYTLHDLPRDVPRDESAGHSDDEKARRFALDMYRRYLANGADDMDAREEIEAQLENR